MFYVNLDIWESKVNVHSSSYKENYKLMSSMVERLNLKLKDVLYEGDQKYIERSRESGKYLGRERIEMLLDPDTPFLELLPLAGCTEKEKGTNICGIGVVSGVECFIGSNLYTIKGGAINEITLKKGERVNRIIEQNRLPCINLVESAGANLTEQFKVFHKGGGSFREMARRSKKGIPCISLVFGSSTAGGAYTPGMSDYTVMVKNAARVFLAGPPLVKEAISEIIDAETLGGAEMHSKISGVSDYLAKDESHALLLCRKIVSMLNYKKEEPFPPNYFGVIEEPRYNPDELLGIVNADIRIPFDAREVIARIVDGSRFHEWKPDFGKTIVCCWAQIHGFKIGILANNGVLFSDTANKAAHFIALSDKRGIPLLFLQNITGFMVGSKQEKEGIIKHGSKLINAVSNVSVPAITIMIGASYGAGNYAMMGRAYEPRFLFSWPNSKVAVMGPDQLVGILTTIAKEAAEKANLPYDEKVAAKKGEALKKLVEKESEPFFISSECLDDGMIDPRDTRNVLGFCLSVIYNSQIQPGGTYGVSRM